MTNGSSQNGRPARRVLIVDDNVDAADMLAELIGEWGHETCVARDGAMALEQAASFKPDVVLLDLGLPDISGHQVAARLRKGNNSSRPVLVALTGYGQETDRQRTLEAGFDRHLVKPPDLEVLEQLLAADLPPG